MVLLSAVVPIGCETKGPDRRPPSGGDRSSDGWRPEAVALRIYPATRFVRERDTSMLEARVELFDAMGDSVKDSGRLRFELFDRGTGPGVEAGPLLYSWDIDVLTLEAQQQYYDPITRAYLLRLRLDSAEVTRQEVLLRVTLQRGGQQERLVDEQPVRVTW